MKQDRCPICRGKKNKPKKIFDLTWDLPQQLKAGARIEPIPRRLCSDKFHL